MALVVSGCGGTWLQVKSSPDANDGAFVMLVARKVDTETFATETYGQIEQLVGTPNESLLIEPQRIEPDQVRWMRVKVPRDADWAVYVLYTEPGRPWKKMMPENRKIHRIELSRWRINE